jgi:hypothetical protein
MPYRIRKTAFSWNPDHESRGDAWERIKTHIQAESSAFSRCAGSTAKRLGGRHPLILSGTRRCCTMRPL